MRSVWKKCLATGAVLILGSMVAHSWKLSLSVAVGAFLVLANFWLLARLVKNLTGAETMVPRWRIAVQFLIKMLLIFGVLAVIILKTKIDAVGFLVGLSTVVIAIAWEGITGLGVKHHA